MSFTYMTPFYLTINMHNNYSYFIFFFLRMKNNIIIAFLRLKISTPSSLASVQLRHRIRVFLYYEKITVTTKANCLGRIRLYWKPIYENVLGSNFVAWKVGKLYLWPELYRRFLATFYTDDDDDSVRTRIVFHVTFYFSFSEKSWKLTDLFSV